MRTDGRRGGQTDGQTHDYANVHTNGFVHSTKHTRARALFIIFITGDLSMMGWSHESSFGKLYQFLAEWIWMSNEEIRECTKNPTNIRLSVEIYNRVRNLTNPSSSYYQYGNLSRVARDFRPANCLQSRKKGKAKKWTNIVTQHNISIPVPRRLLRFIFPGNIYICRGGRYPWMVSALRRFRRGGVERRDHINTLEGGVFYKLAMGLQYSFPRNSDNTEFWSGPTYRKK
jgi:hypothetical protein